MKTCAVLIDGGTREATSEKQFFETDSFPKIINLMILTHFDNDHANGLVTFLRNNAGLKKKKWKNFFTIKNVLLPCRVDNKYMVTSEQETNSNPIV